MALLVLSPVYAFFLRPLGYDTQCTKIDITTLETRHSGGGICARYKLVLADMSTRGTSEQS